MSIKELLFNTNALKSSPFRIAQNEMQLEILLISTFPDRECGIATFSQDLRNSLLDKFGETIKISVCAIENEKSTSNYQEPIKYVLEADFLESYKQLARTINENNTIRLILLQHEFGLFGGDYGNYLLHFLKEVNKPVLTIFHTVLPNPTKERLSVIQKISQLSNSVIVMTENSRRLLENDYALETPKIEVIPHGVHLVTLKNATDLKKEYQLQNKKIVATFGLLSSGKCIETAIYAMPEIIKENPDCIYLIIGKTHPEIIKREGEKYRTWLHQLVEDLGIASNVKFINEFTTNQVLHEYLQLTDIYLFTSNDPYQAVSGTFAYAMGCGCPIISTKIPQALDQLKSAGILIEFQDSMQMANAVNFLFKNPDQMNQMKLNALQNMRPSSWQNVAIQYMNLIEKEISTEELNDLKFTIPEFNLKHFFNVTTEIGIIQFSIAEQPVLDSGYTLDDNARALIALVEYFALTKDESVINLIDTYFRFIESTQQKDGSFLNYVNQFNEYTKQNFQENLEDSNGRAIYALGIFMVHQNSFNPNYFTRIQRLMENTLITVRYFKSPRAIAFAIKGLYNYNVVFNDKNINRIILELADTLIDYYAKNREPEWHWFENSITYANAIIPESLLFAFYTSNDSIYSEIAKESFHFLLEILFEKNHFSVISNRTWYHKDKEVHPFGEQPIDVAYTIIALQEFNRCFKDLNYKSFMKTAFEWYLGNNHLKQIIYNPISGGCYDGLEHNHVNINQGAESTVTYLMARVCIEKEIRTEHEFEEVYVIENSSDNKINDHVQN